MSEVKYEKHNNSNAEPPIPITISPQPVDDMDPCGNAGCAIGLIWAMGDGRWAMPNIRACRRLHPSNKQGQYWPPPTKPFVGPVSDKRTFV